MQIVGGLVALGMISLFGRRSVGKGEKRRGPLINVVFSPHTHIIAKGAQARKPRRANQPRFRLNKKRTRA